jgi:hypothetical protein
VIRDISQDSTCVQISAERQRQGVLGLRLGILYGGVDTKEFEQRSFNMAALADAECFYFQLTNTVERIRKFVNDEDDLAFSVDVSALSL